MWKLEDLLMLRFPRTWELQGVYSTVNGETLDMYLKNMRNLMMEQLTESSLIIINRCDEKVNRAGFRRAVKVQNPMAQLIFENTKGEIIQPTAEDLPYDSIYDRSWTRYPSGVTNDTPIEYYSKRYYDDSTGVWGE